MNVLLFGATGMIGQGVLRECLLDPAATRVVSVSRRPTGATYDLTMKIAEQLVHANPSMTFVYVSGRSTDSTEKGSAMWARVKGRLENALLKLGFSRAYMFRPVAIIPRHGIRSSTRWYNTL